MRTTPGRRRVRPVAQASAIDRAGSVAVRVRPGSRLRVEESVEAVTLVVDARRVDLPADHAAAVKAVLDGGRRAGRGPARARRRRPVGCSWPPCCARVRSSPRERPRRRARPRPAQRVRHVPGAALLGRGADCARTACAGTALPTTASCSSRTRGRGGRRRTRSARCRRRSRPTSWTCPGGCRPACCSSAGPVGPTARPVGSGRWSTRRRPPSGPDGSRRSTTSPPLDPVRDGADDPRSLVPGVHPGPCTTSAAPCTAGRWCSR